MNKTNGIEIFGLLPMMILKAFLRWWHARAEQHYLMCACVEQQKAKEANRNAAYYQKQAAMARSKARES